MPPFVMAAFVGWESVNEVPEIAATTVPFGIPVPPMASPRTIVPANGTTMVTAVDPNEAVPFVAAMNCVGWVVKATVPDTAPMVFCESTIVQELLQVPVTLSTAVR
jgi:hypothetical protein